MPGKYSLWTPRAGGTPLRHHEVHDLDVTGVFLLDCRGCALDSASCCR